jgi:hypothetical protein
MISELLVCRYLLHAWPDAKKKQRLNGTNTCSSKAPSAPNAHIKAATRLLSIG